MKRSSMPSQKKKAGSYARKVASGHVPVKHSSFSKSPSKQVARALQRAMGDTLC